VASRRSADALIAAGSVRVNGRRPPADGMLIDPENDQVTFEGKPVQPRGPRRYYALNKPQGVIVSARDPAGRTTVFDLIEEPVRLFAVGRLDYDSRGLLLLTDDGEVSHRFMHPSHQVPREYLAEVRGIPAAGDLLRLRSGIPLDGKLTSPAEVELVSSGGGASRVRLVLREGRNREVRRMLAAVGHPVRSLTRTAYGPIRLGRLREGGWRRLRQPEVDALKLAAGLR
jgi:23S rRNA pseudouridine2605 synthase